MLSDPTFLADCNPVGKPCPRVPAQTDLLLYLHLRSRVPRSSQGSVTGPAPFHLLTSPITKYKDDVMAHLVLVGSVKLTQILPRAL